MRAIRFLRSMGSVHEQMRRAVCLLAFIAIGSLVVSDAQAANSAETFVQSSIGKTYAILNDASLNASERQEQFHALLVSVVDVKRVALFTLGPYARAGAEADLETFERAFADFLSAVYQRGLETYGSPKVTGSTQRDPDDVIVNVTTATPNGKGPPLRLAFRVRGTNGGGQRITDLQVEGAWLAIIQRAEFSAYLQQHGADIGGLAMELQKRSAQIHLAQSESEINRRER